MEEHPSSTDRIHTLTHSLNLYGFDTAIDGDYINVSRNNCMMARLKPFNQGYSQESTINLSIDIDREEIEKLLSILGLSAFEYGCYPAEHQHQGFAPMVLTSRYSRPYGVYVDGTYKDIDLFITKLDDRSSEIKDNTLILIVYPMYTPQDFTELLNKAYAKGVIAVTRYNLLKGVYTVYSPYLDNTGSDHWVSRVMESRIREILILHSQNNTKHIKRAAQE